MTAQKTRWATDEVSPRTADKGITFTASSSWNSRKPLAILIGAIALTHQEPHKEAGPAELQKVQTQKLPRSASRAAWLHMGPCRSSEADIFGNSVEAPAEPPAAHHITQEQIPLRSARLEGKFPPIQAEELVQAHLPSRLAGEASHSAWCIHLAIVLTAETRDLVKAVTRLCYQLVCSVSIGSRGRTMWQSLARACEARIQLCHLQLCEPHAFSVWR